MQSLKSPPHPLCSAWEDEGKNKKASPPGNRACFFWTWFFPSGALRRSLCDLLLLFSCESGCRKVRNLIGLESLDKLSLLFSYWFLFPFYCTISNCQNQHQNLVFKFRMLHINIICPEVQHCLPASPNLCQAGSSVVCIVIFFCFLWLAEQQQGQETLQCVALLQRVGAEPQSVGRGLFLGMFRSSTESPYKAPHLGGWWKVGYQCRWCFFLTGPTRLHLVNTSPAHILTPRTSWSQPRVSSTADSRGRSSLSHLDFFS